MGTALTPGTIVDRYKVVGVLGAGSMGDVVRGVDVDLNRQVAIKILSERHRENEELRARFVREARAVAAISHPNVVQVFTTGNFDKRPYLAMELLDGVDLGTVVKQHGVMSSVQASRAALDAARGLEAAAKAGLIHRDVKPSNLVLLTSGVVKVTDFGLAKPLDPGAEPALTAMGVVVGTPDYIAPEQARGDGIDERVDIYALGGTIYFLVTGSPPFRTGNPAEDKYLKVVARHLKEPAPDPRTANPAVDGELAALQRQMMSKKAGERPRYSDLIQRLTAIVERLQVKGSPALPQVSSSGRGPAVPDKTPFVGGGKALEAEAADAGEDSAETMVKESARQEEAARRGGTSTAAADMAAAPRLSRWLVAVTVVSGLIFLTGLGLLLFGPRGAPAAAPPSDAAPRADAAPLVRPDPVAPAGMVLVRKPDGAPWMFIAAAPVSHGEYAEAHPDEKQPQKRKKLNAQPVVQVAYAQAESHARSRGARLPTPDEWAAAAKTAGFKPAGKLAEWVDDGSVGQQAARAVRVHPDRAEKLRPGPHANVTFRLAKDL
jgi:eukaryotic-like serine/threonine-protein kinase